jgi:hypothetical protein
MPSPFPGMDPFLENPVVFPDLHDSLVIYLREAVQARLPETYYAALGSRVWIDFSERLIGPDVKVLRTRTPQERGAGGVATAPAPQVGRVRVYTPQDETREPFVEVYARDGRRLVTSIEVLSPTNKSPGAHGRDLYLQKQRELFRGRVHLVEIDLLRGGQHTTAVPLERALADAGRFDYHVCVREFDKLHETFVYPIQLAQRLPQIDVPLLPGDAAVPVDLQALFDRCYDVGVYRRRIDYAGGTPIPPLNPEYAEWADQLLRQQGLRPPA